MGLFSRILLHTVAFFIFIGDLLLLFLKIVGEIVAFIGKCVVDTLIFLGDVCKEILNQWKNTSKKIVHGIRGNVKKITFKNIQLPKFKAFWKIKRFHLLKLKKKEKEIITVQKGRESVHTAKKARHIHIKFRYFMLGVFTALLIVLFQRAHIYVESLPNPRLIGNVNFPVSTQIYDRNGNLLYDVFRDEDRTPVVLKNLPKHVIDATLAIEDRNFYNHYGISLIGGVLRAIKETYRTGDLQGGSTLTQQLVKTSLLTPERTFERKFKEAILALWAERIYSKDQILEMYLNQVSYGGTAYGIEEAAKTYFNTSAKDLTLNQSAFLAGLTRAPSTYSPYLNPHISIQRRNEVLQSMKESGYISDATYQQEIKKQLKIEPPKTFIRAPHFVFYIKSLLEQKYGIRRVEEGGLRVVTSLDIDMQDEFEDILNEELEKIRNLDVSNGAILVTAPSTGEILAMIGSKDYYQEPYGAFNVTTARRQPGSSIKPLMYAMALESGKYTAASVIDDNPVVYQIPGSPAYRPLNYDNRFHGPTPLRYALANSYNITAVKVLNELGVRKFVDFAEELGISTWDTPERYGLSLTLGGAEVKLTDMAVAFGTFANYGKKVELNPILSVEDYRGKVLEKFSQPVGKEVLSEETSFIMSDILSDNFARQSAFGPQSDLVIPGYKVAVKTGTTNSKRDNWTDGYTRKFFVGVWVGNNDNKPMNQLLTSGITGASPIWHRVMMRVLERNIPISSPLSDGYFTVPQGIETRTCHFGKIEYFKAGTEQRQDCNSKPLTTTPIPVSPRLQDTF